MKISNPYSKGIINPVTKRETVKEKEKQGCCFNCWQHRIEMRCIFHLHSVAGLKELNPASNSKMFKNQCLKIYFFTAKTETKHAQEFSSKDQS